MAPMVIQYYDVIRRGDIAQYKYKIEPCSGVKLLAAVIHKLYQQAAVTFTLI